MIILYPTKINVAVIFVCSLLPSAAPPPTSSSSSSSSSAQIKYKSEALLLEPTCSVRMQINKTIFLPSGTVIISQQFFMPWHFKSCATSHFILYRTIKFSYLTNPANSSTYLKFSMTARALVSLTRRISCMSAAFRSASVLSYPGLPPFCSATRKASITFLTSSMSSWWWLSETCQYLTWN
jgi:hypothetical protein